MSGGRDRSSRGRRLFLATSWIPLASFVAAHAYVDRFDGWGQWAAAPILLLPVLLGAAFTLAGTVLARREQTLDGIRPSTWTALALASVPLLWLVWRLVVAL